MLERLLGVGVGKETVRRITETMGSHLEAAQTAAAQVPWQEESVETPPPHHLAISADGAHVPLIKGQWAEVRTLAIGEIEEQGQSARTAERHVGHLSYFSRLTDATTFSELAEVEMRRRRVIQTRQVCAVTDGADWLQAFIDLHRSDAVRILDFPHAAEHLASLLEALKQAGHRFPPRMLERCLHVLKHRGPRPLLRMADRLPAEEVEQEGVREHLNYLRKREALMQYPRFQQQGWPIGSGMVESANKLVVQARLKGAGMHWKVTHVNPLLALRNAVCNDRWQECWHQAREHLHHHQAHRRKPQAKPLTQASSTPQAQSTYASFPSTASLEQNKVPLVEIPAPHCPSPPAAPFPGSSRPSAAHPWRRTPACRPKPFVKR